MVTKYGHTFLTKSTGGKPAGSGNLTTRANEGQPTTYTYSPSQPHAVTKLSGNSTASYTYDNNGNMTNRTEAGITYTQQFDVQNRLTQVTVNNASTTKFHYDASGRRTLTQEPNGDLIYTPFPAYEEEIPGAAPESLPIQRVTFGLGRPIAIAPPCYQPFGPTAPPPPNPSPTPATPAGATTPLLASSTTTPATTPPPLCPHPKCFKCTRFGRFSG